MWTILNLSYWFRKIPCLNKKFTDDALRTKTNKQKLTFKHFMLR